MEEAQLLSLLCRPTDVIFYARTHTHFLAQSEKQYEVRYKIVYVLSNNATSVMNVSIVYKLVLIHMCVCVCCAGQHEPPPPRQHAGLLPESLIWAYIVQLSSALRTIHTAGLACRVMDPSKILITGKTRYASGTDQQGDGSRAQTCKRYYSIVALFV